MTLLVLHPLKVSAHLGAIPPCPIHDCSEAGVLGSLVCMGGFVAMGPHAMDLRVISHEHNHTLEKRWNDDDARLPHASERGEDDDDIWSCCLMESGGRALSSSYFARSPFWLKNVRTLFVPPPTLLLVDSCLLFDRSCPLYDLPTVRSWQSSTLDLLPSLMRL